MSSRVSWPSEQSIKIQVLSMWLATHSMYDLFMLRLAYLWAVLWLPVAMEAKGSTVLQCGLRRPFT